MSGVIVLGYNGSECAEAALDFTLELAASTGDRVLIAYAAAPVGRGIGDEYHEMAVALAEIAKGATASALARAEARGVPAETVVIEDAPVPGLVELARERGARMIVVGTTSERPLTGLILGATPYKLLHRSPVPVLVVPLPDES